MGQSSFTVQTILSTEVVGGMKKDVKNGIFDE